MMSDRQSTHRKSHTRVYRIWSLMMNRCYNPKFTRYDLWGGKGIRVCDRWHTFENFHADMGEPPTDRHSIDRINNDQGYCLENCKWSTMREQSNNRSSFNVTVSHDGLRLNLSQWAERIDISAKVLYQRYKRGDRPPQLFRPLVRIRSTH